MQLKAIKIANKKKELYCKLIFARYSRDKFPIRFYFKDLPYCCKLE